MSYSKRSRSPAPNAEEKCPELGEMLERLRHAGLERETQDPLPMPVVLSYALGDVQDPVLLGEP